MTNNNDHNESTSNEQEDDNLTYEELIAQELIAHEIDFTINDDFETVEYNEELIGKYYQVELESTDDYDDWADQINEIFWEEVGCQGTYYETKIFNEAIAFECGLMPFKYQGKNMLALQNCEKGHIAWLSTYEVLTDIIITNNIYYFTPEGKLHDHTAFFIEKSVLEKLQKIYTRVLNYNSLVTGDKIQENQLAKTSS